MEQNYSQLIERIARVCGLPSDEINRKVEAKRAKLSGLISREGAAQIIAAELGVNFEKENIKINELVPGMKRVNVVGKVVELSPVREFNKNGREGKVLGILLGDETSSVRTVLWDTNHISLFEKSEIKEGDVIQISNASIRNNELHLNSFSEIKKSDEIIENVKEKVGCLTKKIIELNTGENVQIRAFIVQMFEPRFFEICPECNKKVENGECATHGKVAGIKRALLNLVLDDGSETIRAVLFNEQLAKLGVSDEELNNSDVFLKKRDFLLGEEKILTASVRQNKMFNNQELFISDITNIQVDDLITQLEKNNKEN